MTIRRSPSAMRLLSGCTGGLPSGDAPEYRPDGHAEPRQVALAENVAGHDLTRRENIGASAQPLDFGSFIHFHAQIRKRDSRPQGIAVEGRPVDSLRPVGLRGIETFSPAVIEDLVIETARPHRLVEFTNSRFEVPRRQAEPRSQFCDACRGNRWKHGGHEAARRFRIDDGPCDLIRLLSDEASPDRIAFGPKILAFVIKTLGSLVDDDAEGDAIQPRDNAAVKFGRAAIDGDGVALLWIAHRFGAQAHQQPEQPALVIGRAANNEISCGFAP